MTALDRGEVTAVLPWPAEGVGDFADVAWVLAQAFGNGPGVRGVEIRRLETGGTHAYLTTTGPEYVRAVAAAFGWSLYEPDHGYANASGRLGEVLVSVSFVERGRVNRAARAADGAVSS